MDIIKKYYPYLTALFVLIIYFVTLAPSVMQIDTGELAAAQATLGIAHPTGYPLFTMIGYLFLKIPFPASKIFQSNLLASLFCAGAIILFIKSLSLIFDFTLFQPVHAIKDKKKKEKTSHSLPLPLLSGIEKYFVLAATALIIAFNETFWQQSTSVEVYSLQALLFMNILFFAIRFFIVEKPALKDYLLLSASVAFGFTNHMTTLLFIPGLIYLFFAKTGFSKEVFRKILLMLLLFLAIVAVVYSYLFIRAAQNPPLNWGNTINPDNFLRHVSGSQYQVWMFSSIEDAKKQLADYIINLPSVFAYLPLIFSLAGFSRLYKLNKKLFTFFFITYLFSVLYVINYSIHDISSYFLLSHIMLAIFAGFGIVKVYITFKNKFSAPYYRHAAISGVVIILFVINFGKVNSSGVFVYEDYTKTILNSVPQNSIIFSYQWDYLVASSYYFQKVENYRSDVAIIDKELLRRSWYYNQMERNFPSVINGIKPEINSFLEALKPFEKSRDFDSVLLESGYQAIMTGLISSNISSRDYFIGPEFLENELKSGEFKLPQGYSLVPYGLLLKVVTKNEYTPDPSLDFKIRFPKERDAYSSYIYNQTGAMLLRRAIYELDFNYKDKAQEIITKIRNDLPEYVVPVQIIERLRGAN